MDKQRTLFVKWPALWKTICEMSYYRRCLTDQILVEIEDYELLEMYKNMNPNEFRGLTIDYMWKDYSETRDYLNKYIEPQVVPELKYLFVPRILFETLGVYTWFQFSFPNCKVEFWEDSMKSNIV
jgi:hypothetical protein